MKENKTLEEIIQKATQDSLTEEYITEQVSKAMKIEINNIIQRSLSYGESHKILQSKIESMMVPAIEKHNFNDYIVKIDDVLTQIINETDLIDNKKILDNFKELMVNDYKLNQEIKLSEIFEKWQEYVSENVDTDKLEVLIEERPSYENVIVNVVKEENPYTTSNFNDLYVKFTCENDDEMNFELWLYKYKEEDNWSILRTSLLNNLTSLRLASKFEIYMTKLRRSYVKIEDDLKEDEYDIEVDAEPEATFQ